MRVSIFIQLGKEIFLFILLTETETLYWKKKLFTIT